MHYLLNSGMNKSKIALDIDLSFLFIWFTAAVGEFVVMAAHPQPLPIKWLALRYRSILPIIANQTILVYMLRLMLSYHLLKCVNQILSLSIENELVF